MTVEESWQHLSPPGRGPGLRRFLTPSPIRPLFVRLLLLPSFLSGIDGKAWRPPRCLGRWWLKHQCERGSVQCGRVGWRRWYGMMVLPAPEETEYAPGRECYGEQSDHRESLRINTENRNICQMGPRDVGVTGAGLNEPASSMRSALRSC